MAGRKKKNKITLFTLLFAMVLLIGAYFAVVHYNDSKAAAELKKESAKTVTLASLKTDLIGSIYFSNLNSTMTLIRDEKSGWQYQEDALFPVNQSFASDMETALASITSEVTVAENANNLKEYGLDKPAIQVVATLKDGTSTSIALGAKAPIADGYYATVNGKNTVYVVSSVFYDSFNKSIKQMMTVEEIPALKAESITHLMLVNKDKGNVEFKYDEDQENVNNSSANWTILQPYATQVSADSTAVTGLLGNYTQMAFDSAVDYNVKDLSKYGLDNPSVVLSMEYYTEEAKDTNETTGSETTSAANSASQETTEPATTKVYHTYELSFGKTDKDGNYYVKSGDSNIVYIMNASSVEKLTNVEPYSIVDKNISMININTVDKIELQSKDKTYTMSINRTTKKDTNKDTGKEEEQVVKNYSINGKAAKEADFLKIYQTIITPVTEREIPSDYENQGSQTPILTVTFHRNTNENKTIVVQYLPYDESFNIVNTNGKQYFLTDKRKIDEIIKSFN